MTPLPIADGSQIPIAWLAKELSTSIEPIVQWITLATLFIAAIGSLIFFFVPRSNTFVNNLFKVSIFWTITRVIGAVFSVLIIFQIGPEAIWSENTGGLLLSPDGLVSSLFSLFLFAGLLLPLLLNFGLLEFFGTMMVKIMRPLFKLPGRSAVDALTSWVGDGTIGVLLTSRQYEEGYYTKKEAAIIGSTFSVVSITFCIVVLEEVGLGDYFVPYYLTVLLCGVILAFIMPRIYPLARKEDKYIDGRPLDLDAEKFPENYNAVTHGLEKALKTADKNRSVSKFFSDGFKNVIDMYIGVTPVVLAFGTIALVLAEYTSVFVILGKPFEPLLILFGIPEAAAAAQTLVVGFADMFLPSILGASIESEMTRFFIATMSVTQLIYMSEVGGLLLGSKIPVNIKDLIIIFLLRTLISFPIIALVAHLLF